MKEFTFSITTEFCEEDIFYLKDAYLECNKQGIYDSFEEFLDDAVGFRMNDHIMTNARFLKQYSEYFLIGERGWMES